jgi:excisionase family DNA binding protein
MKRTKAIGHAVARKEFEIKMKLQPFRNAASNAMSRLVTVQDASQYLAVSVSTLYGWVFQRRIPFVKVGRALRFDLADLDGFIETNRTRSK